MRWIRRLFVKGKGAWDPLPTIPDPLQEKFDALAREVRQREAAERQARCEHEQTHLLLRIGMPPQTICAHCGKAFAP